MDEPQPAAEPPGRPATTATRRRLLVGAGVLAAAAAVPTGIVVPGDRGSGKANDKANDKAKRPANGSRGSTPAPLRTPPPVAIPAHPTLNRLGTLKGHHYHGGVGDFRFSPDGTTLVSSEFQGGVLRLWDVAGRKKRATVTLPGTRPTVEHRRGSTATSEPGAMVVINNGGITITRLGTRSILQFALSPDGRTVATAGAVNNNVALWRLE
jgi:hypothetical protein